MVEAAVRGNLSKCAACESALNVFSLKVGKYASVVGCAGPCLGSFSTQERLNCLLGRMRCLAKSFNLLQTDCKWNRSRE